MIFLKSLLFLNHKYWFILVYVIQIFRGDGEVKFSKGMFLIHFVSGFLLLSSMVNVSASFDGDGEDSFTDPSATLPVTTVALSSGDSLVVEEGTTRRRESRMHVPQQLDTRKEEASKHLLELRCRGNVLCCWGAEAFSGTALYVGRVGDKGVLATAAPLLRSHNFWLFRWGMVALYEGKPYRCKIVEIRPYGISKLVITPIKELDGIPIMDEASLHDNCHDFTLGYDKLWGIVFNAPQSNRKLRVKGIEERSDEENETKNWGLFCRLYQAFFKREVRTDLDHPTEKISSGYMGLGEYFLELPEEEPSEGCIETLIKASQDHPKIAESLTQGGLVFTMTCCCGLPAGIVLTGIMGVANFFGF